jgi:WD40 repeat protein
MSDDLVVSQSNPRESKGGKKRRLWLWLAVIVGVTLAGLGIGYSGLTEGAISERKALTGHRGIVWGIAFTPDGQKLVSGAQDGLIKIWDVSTGEELATLQGHEGSILSLALAADGKTLATGSRDATARIWDLNSRKMLDTLHHEFFVTSVAFRPDASMLVTGSGDDVEMEMPARGKIRIWHLPKCTEGKTLLGHGKGALQGLLFTPDGKFLISSCADLPGKVRWWDVDSGNCLAAVDAHHGPVYALALTRDGRTLASGGIDKTIKLWDAASRTVTATLEGHHQGITRLAFSPSGKILASGDGTGRVRFWEVATGVELDSFLAHDTWISGIAFSPDGKTLATARGGPLTGVGEPGPGEIKLWNVNSEQAP